MRRTRNKHLLPHSRPAKAKKLFKKREKKKLSLAALHTLWARWSIVFWNVRFFHFCSTLNRDVSPTTILSLFLFKLFFLLFSSPHSTLSSIINFTAHFSSSSFHRWLIDFQMDTRRRRRNFKIFLLTKNAVRLLCTVVREAYVLVHVNGHPLNGRWLQRLMISNSLFFIGASNRQARILYAVNQKCSRKFTDRVYEISKQSRTCSQKQHWSVTSDSADDDLSLARFFLSAIPWWRTKQLVSFCAWVDHWTVKIIRVSAQRFHWSVFYYCFLSPNWNFVFKSVGDLRRISCAMCESLLKWVEKNERRGQADARIQWVFERKTTHHIPSAHRSKVMYNKRWQFSSQLCDKWNFLLPNIPLTLVGSLVHKFSLLAEHSKTLNSCTMTTKSTKAQANKKQSNECAGTFFVVLFEREN